MVADAIRKAKATRLFDIVAVSSDDLEILSIAASEGAIPMWRTPEASSDTADDDDVAKEVLRYFPQELYACKLYPCVPLLEPIDLIEAWRIMRDTGRDIYSVDKDGKDAGAFYFFAISSLWKKGTIATDRHRWTKYTLEVCQDINTPEDFEEAKRKANVN